MPLVGFLPANDPRVAATDCARIERELMDRGLVYRTLHSAQQSQGAFLACSGWLADCRQMQGRTDAARKALERLIEVRSGLGLLSEEYDTSGKHLSGNFPQALSHLALVTSGARPFRSGASARRRLKVTCPIAMFRSAANVQAYPGSR